MVIIHTSTHAETIFMAIDSSDGHSINHSSNLINHIQQ